MLTSPSPIRLGVVGTGTAFERLHWPALRRLADRYRVVAAADRSLEKARQTLGRVELDAPAFGAVRELLDSTDAEAILVAVPMDRLLQVATDVLRSGRHVMCEKPAGLSMADARTFASLPERFPGLTIMIGENYFYRDELRLAKQLVESDAIGAIHLAIVRFIRTLTVDDDAFLAAHWRQREGFVNSPLFDGGVHRIAQMRMILGDIASVASLQAIANRDLRSPSEACVIFTAGSAIGAYVEAHIDRALSDEGPTMQLFGEKGTLSFENERIEVELEGMRESYAFNVADGGYFNEWWNFFEAVRYGAPLVGDVAQSVRNVVTLLAMDASARSGRRIGVDPLCADAGPVRLWQPVAAADLFEGLPTTVVRSPLTAS